MPEGFPAVVCLADMMAWFGVFSLVGGVWGNCWMGLGFLRLWGGLGVGWGWGGLYLIFKRWLWGGGGVGEGMGTSNFFRV